MSWNGDCQLDSPLRCLAPTTCPPAGAAAGGSDGFRVSQPAATVRADANTGRRGERTAVAGTGVSAAPRVVGSRAAARAVAAGNGPAETQVGAGAPPSCRARLAVSLRQVAGAPRLVPPAHRVPVHRME